MQEIPYGLCQCGCGGVTPRATHTNAKKGRVKGQHTRYLRGHSGTKRREWAEEDRGYDTPCWIWQLALYTTGYGAKKVAGASALAHRVIYERLVGPIPDGLHLDHLCRVRACVNPAHLEPVTHLENVRRGIRDNPNWGGPPAGTRGKSAAILQDLEASGMTRLAIAVKHGVHRTYVDMIARGVRGPNSRRST